MGERKLLECQVKDCATRLDDAEANALKGGKKAMNKMETRIRELESEVDAEQRRMGDSMKNQTRMQGLVDGLQDKIKSYKKQIEEAEEIASLNLTKFRGTQAQVADSGELADLNEKALAKAKAKARGASVAL